MTYVMNTVASTTSGLQAHALTDSYASSWLVASDYMYRIITLETVFYTLYTNQHFN